MDAVLPDAVFDGGGNTDVMLYVLGTGEAKGHY
jgi:hypothetical protein